MAISTRQLMGSRSAGIAIGAITAVGAILGFNATRQPDQQTVQGISNQTLIFIAVAVVAVAWITDR
jgi:hypothetical protein